MYHRVGERVKNSIVPDHYVSRHLFEKQLDTLSRHGYRTISLQEMEAAFLAEPHEKKEKLIVLTFDDGYESFYTDALPILRQRAMKASVFLVSDCLGLTNRWDEAKGDTSERLMTPEQILACQEQGTEFGGHTKTHPDLRFCDDKQAEDEVVGCRQELLARLQIPIDWFCYPYGAHGDRERSLVRKAGYKGACATGKTTNSKETDPCALSRVNVRATTSPAYLLYKLHKASKRNG